MPEIIHIDCTMRDGGYYNNWNFSPELISAYISAMSLVSVDIVELGFRSLDVDGYCGPGARQGSCPMSHAAIAVLC